MEGLKLFEEMYRLTHKDVPFTKRVTVTGETIEECFSFIKEIRGVKEEDSLEGEFSMFCQPHLKSQEVADDKS